MTTPPPTSTDTPADTSAETSGGRSSATIRLVALVVLAAIALGSLVSLGVLYAQRTDASAGSLGGRASQLLAGGDPAQGARDAVMAPARTFMLRINTYGPDLLDASGQMPDYRSGVEEVITPKFKASFEQGVVAAEQSVAQAQIQRTAQVFATGVSSIDGDSARVLVAGSFTNSYPNPRKPAERVDDEPAPFRVEVSMVFTAGTWLVDDFSPITDGSTAGSGPTAPPSTQPGNPPSTQPRSRPSGPGKAGKR